MKPKKTFNVLHYLHTFVITSSSGLSIACLTSPYEIVNRTTDKATIANTRLAINSFSNMFFIIDSTNHLHKVYTYFLLFELCLAVSEYQIIV